MLATRLGRFDEARQQLEAQLKIEDELTSEFPTETHHAVSSANSRINLGNIMLELGKLKEARNSFEEAVERFDQLVREERIDAKSRVQQTMAKNNLALVLGDLGEVAAARRELEESIAIGEELTNSDEARPEYAHSLARNHINLARLIPPGESLQAMKHHDAAIDILTRLRKRFPSVPDYRHKFASVHHMNMSSKPKLAIEQFEQAKRLLEPIVAANSQFPKALEFLTNAHIATGHALARMLKMAAAGDAFGEAAKLAVEPRKSTLIVMQALHLGRGGRYVAATKLAEELSESQPGNVSTLFHCSRVFARAVGLAENDIQLDEATRKERVDEYVAQTFRILKIVAKTGLFRQQPSVFDGDPDFDAIKKRKDFQELRRQLEGGN